MWDDIKRTEKDERRSNRLEAGVADEPEEGFLGGVPMALPALTRAHKLTGASREGRFRLAGRPLRWSRRFYEELDEVGEAAASAIRTGSRMSIRDLLFAAANLARHYGIDPETALRCTNAKFERHFSGRSKRLSPRQGQSLNRG